MAYKLTLTAEEQAAFDWVGGRYPSTGYDMSSLIWSTYCGPAEDEDGREIHWGMMELTFNIPENVSWQMIELVEQEDGYWPCFGDDLADKMQAFIDRIV